MSQALMQGCSEASILDRDEVSVLDFTVVFVFMLMRKATSG